MDIVNRVVERVMHRLDRGDDYRLTALDKWQLETLEQAGYLRADLQREIAARTGLMLEEMAEAFEDAGVRSFDWDSAIYEAAGIATPPLKRSPQFVRLMQRAYDKTAGEFRNFTGTLADAAQQLFISETDKAYHLVSSGALGYAQAIREAVEEIAAGGVKVNYPSGHTDTIETATFRAVRTGVGQACGDVTLARMRELDWDIVLTSAHLGARTGDGGDNWTNHYWWQGRFFSLSGRERRFPRFDVCGYGQVDGLMGANCRHSVGPGDGETNPWEKYDSEANRLREEQDKRQRLLERRIRAAKREVMGLKTARDSAQTGEARAELEEAYRDAALKLRRLNKAYDDFCEENNVQKLHERLTVAKWDRKQAASASAAARGLEKKANSLYNLGSTERNVKAYLARKNVHDELEAHGIQFKTWANSTEAVVDAGRPRIVAERFHAKENRETRTDRVDMTMEMAQSFVDTAKVTLYQTNRENLKFLADEGYAILNLNHELVTAVPQKWRKKYNRFLEGTDATSK